jgi:acyl carrier protein
VEVYEKIKKIISDRFGVSEDRVTMEATFKNDLGADSLDVVELVMELEDAFDIEVPDEDAEGLTTVGAVVEYIKTKI